MPRFLSELCQRKAAGSGRDGLRAGRRNKLCSRLYCLLARAARTERAGKPLIEVRDIEFHVMHRTRQSHRVARQGYVPQSAFASIEQNVGPNVRAVLDGAVPAAVQPPTPTAVEGLSRKRDRRITAFGLGSGPQPATATPPLIVGPDEFTCPVGSGTRCGGGFVVICVLETGLMLRPVQPSCRISFVTSVNENGLLLVVDLDAARFNRKPFLHPITIRSGITGIDGRCRNGHGKYGRADSG